MHANAAGIGWGQCMGAPCEAKPTTLKCPSPGDGFESHMCHTTTCSNMNIISNSIGLQLTQSHDVLLMLSPWIGKALAFSRVHHAALATHALKDIPFETLVLVTVSSFVLLTSVRPWLVESLKWWSAYHLNPTIATFKIYVNFETLIYSVTGPSV